MPSSRKRACTKCRTKHTVLTGVKCSVGKVTLPEQLPEADIAAPGQQDDQGRWNSDEPVQQKQGKPTITINNGHTFMASANTASSPEHAMLCNEVK